MMRRVAVVAVLLFVVALPATAKRRAVSPRTPSSCATGTLVQASYANVLAADGEFVYIVNESAELVRVPRLGGPVQLLAESLDGMLPLAMTVGTTHVYISTLPFEAIFTPLPGSIIAVPKSGGVIEVIASGVETALTIASDDTHVYWAAAGILDFSEGEFRSGGKIERMKKDGSERTTLASDLSAPLGLAVSGDHVFFGESGLATGDPDFGLHRVSKSGGAVTTLRDDLLVASLAVDAESLVILGGSPEGDFGLFEYDRTGSGALRPILEDESLAFNMQLVDGTVYVIAEREATELLAVDLDAPGVERVIRTDLGGDAFVIADCAAIVNTMDGDIVRTAR